jgi:hypothetical protein
MCSDHSPNISNQHGFGSCNRLALVVPLESMLLGRAVWSGLKQLVSLRLTTQS